MSQYYTNKICNNLWEFFKKVENDLDQNQLETLSELFVVKNILAERIPKHILLKFSHVGLISRPYFHTSTYWYFAKGGSEKDNVWIANEKHSLEVKKYFENYILA